MLKACYPVLKSPHFNIEYLSTWARIIFLPLLLQLFTVSGNLISSLSPTFLVVLKVLKYCTANLQREIRTMRREGYFIRANLLRFISTFKGEKYYVIFLRAVAKYHISESKIWDSWFFCKPVASYGYEMTLHDMIAMVMSLEFTTCIRNVWWQFSYLYPNKHTERLL